MIPEKWEPVFRKDHAHEKRDSDPIGSDQNLRVGKRRRHQSPPPTALSGGRVETSLPSVAFRWNYAPLRRKVKRAVKSPSFTARFFRLSERYRAALHEDADRAMVIESTPT